MRAKEFTEPSAAGCILYAEDTGRWGLQQRSDSVDDPGLWAAWGGGREPGETLEQTARRELAEESGYRGPITLEPLARNAKYVTFVGIVPHEFEPRPCDEWKDYCWVELGRWPTPMHPGVAAALENVYIKENTEFVDVNKIHQAGLREHLLSNPSLYENREDFANLRKFLGLHSTAEPQVGKNYVYCSVQATPIANYISVACFGQPHRLVKIKDHVAYFEFNGKIKRFPETGSLSGDAMSQIYFFNSSQEFNNFNTVMQLKFSNYRYNYKNLDSDAYVKENFADGKVKGKSRPGRVKRSGASCDGSVTDLRAKAKKYGGERGRMYHWCANMKSGKKKK